MWIFSSFFAYHMLALYSLVGSIFCPSSVFFVVHGAPLEVPSFLYYLVQFGAAALHFRFRFQWLFRCPLPLSLSLSLLLFDWLWAWRPLIHPPVDDSSESHPAPTWGICWALAAQRQLVPYHQAAIVAKSRRLSVVTFPIPCSPFPPPSSFVTSPFLHSPLQFPMFILLESHFAAACAKLPAGVCILRHCRMKSLTVKCGYLVNRAPLSRSHATQQPLDSRPMFLVYLQTSNQQRVNCNF